jgi:hypothetical protein
MGYRYLLVIALVATALAAALAACGGGDDGDEPRARPVASHEDFPRANGRTLGQLRDELGPGPVVAPAVSLLERGDNRFGFGLFDRSRKQIAEAPAAVYVSKEDGTDVRGPFLARYESLGVKPEFRSESVTADPDAAESLYVSELEFERPGRYALLAAVRLDDRVVATDPIPVEVVRDGKVPEPGERPPRIETPTVDEVREISEIDTRVPPSPDLHEVDFADALGKRPIVLMFATPALCVSRVCGPVVDIMKQVKAETGTDAAWIHMEIYKDNEVDRGFREQVLAWNLPTEPWAFTIDREGRVAARLEGAFSARELRAAVDAATRG